jgi:CMP-N-acetylneuraminic acid synthetase
LSLIAHAARTARSLDWIDCAVLSTDDEEMAEEGRRHGLEVPFLRPAELASDTASGVDAWRHAWLECERIGGCRFDLSVLLQPTTPLRRPEEVERTLRALVDGGHRAAATVGRVPLDYTPERCLRRASDGRLSFYHPGGAKVSRRQDFETLYFRDGTCYAVTRECLVDDGWVIEDDCVGVVIERYVVNIDEPFELALADFLYERGGEL